MIIGVGVDICQVQRLADALQRHPGLANRLFSVNEQSDSQNKARKVESLAARFAAKEALAKALSVTDGFSWLDGEVISQQSGSPEIKISGTLKARADQLGVENIHLSLSHDAGLAIAFVICEGSWKR